MGLLPKADREAIAEVDKAIEDGKAWLPADASLLQWDEAPESPDLAEAFSHPEAMTTTEMRQSVEAIEQYIKRAQVLLPEDASLLLRFAYRLPAMTSVLTVGFRTDYEAIRAFPAPWGPVPLTPL
jgi:hypothetical protein